MLPPAGGDGARWEGGGGAGGDGAVVLGGGGPATVGVRTVATGAWDIAAALSGVMVLMGGGGASPPPPLPPAGAEGTGSAPAETGALEPCCAVNPP